MGCAWCRDTGDYNGQPCPSCCGGLPLLARIKAAQRLREISLDRLPPSSREMIVAQLIRRRTIENPIKIAEISAKTGLHEREVKDIVRTLRSVYLLPVASSRSRPAGYYWARSWDEWEPYVRQFRGQALDEMRTIYRVTKANWPDFVGQLKFDFDVES